MVRVTLLAFGVAALTLPAAQMDGWDRVSSLAPGTKIEVLPQDRSQPHIKGTLLSASPEALRVQARSGELAWQRSEIRIVKIEAPGRRARNGLIGVAIGAAAGLAIGEAVCVYCRNEGHPGFGIAGLAAGAGVGALAFLPTPYQTVFKAPRR